MATARRFHADGAEGQAVIHELRKTKKEVEAAGEISSGLKQKFILDHAISNMNGQALRVANNLVSFKTFETYARCGNLFCVGLGPTRESARLCANEN